MHTLVQADKASIVRSVFPMQVDEHSAH